MLRTNWDISYRGLESFRDEHGVLFRVALREALDAASHRAPSTPAPAHRPRRSRVTARASPPWRLLLPVPPLQRVEPQAAHGAARLRLHLRLVAIGHAAQQVLLRLTWLGIGIG
jgi:hypothetical protein